MFFEWVVIVIFVSGENFIEVLKDLLFLMVVIEVLVLMWKVISFKFFSGLLSILVVWEVM